MRVIFLGILFCEASLQEAYNDVKRGISIAPHVFQKNLLDGFDQMDDVDVDILHIPPVGSFPINNKRLFAKKYRWGKNNTQIGYLNLPFIKHGIQKRKLLKEISKRIKAERDPAQVRILVYSVYEPFLDVIKKVKKKYPAVEVCLIQTDPVMGRGERDRYMTPAAVAEGNRIVEKSKRVDKFVLLTKYLAEPMEVEERPFTVIECVCDATQEPAKQGRGNNTCLYTGSLNEEFGIKRLAEAFSQIPNAELWICGDGDTKNFLKEYTQTHTNIKYFGFLPREEIAKMRDDCDFLINPRTPTGTYTKYSFPSKTVEYILSAKPVIMYKLEGIPDEFDAYLNYIYGQDMQTIADELKAIFAQDYVELAEKAKQARCFVLENKNGKKQAEKIVDLMK